MNDNYDDNGDNNGNGGARIEVMDEEQPSVLARDALKRYSFLYQAARTLNTTLDTDQILQQLMNLTHQHFQPDAVSVAFVEDDGTLAFRAASGKAAKDIMGMRLPQGTGIAGWVAQNGEPLWIADTGEDPRFYQGADEKTGFTSEAIYAVPVQHARRTLAVLEMVNPPPDLELHEAREIMVTLAALAASAIRKAELFAQVSRAEERYQRLFDLNIDPIVIMTAEGELLEFNQAAQQLLSHCDIQTGGTCLPFLGLSAETFREFQERLEEEKTIVWEATIPTAEGKERTLEVHLTFLEHYNADGVYQWLAHDVTDRVALQAMREQLSHMIVHDLRNPLGNIISSVKLIKNAWDEQDITIPIQQILHIALRNAQRMDRLIGNILDTARFRSGDTTLSLDDIDVSEMVREVEETTQPSLIHRKQQLTVNLPSDLPTLRGDFDLLRRTLTNLLDNASKFSPARGSLELTLTYSEEAFRFTIVDSGPGVPVEDQERIFDLYMRGKDQQVSGAGIGLAFCKLVVEAHGGRIWVDNPGEEGAVFVFTIPREIPTESMYFGRTKS